MNLTRNLLSGILVCCTFSVHAQNCSTLPLDNKTLCKGETYTFTAAPGRMIYAGADTSLLNTGSEYPVLVDESRTFTYGNSYKIGPVNTSIGAADYSTSTNYGVTFDTDRPVILNTVDFFPRNAGSVEIELVRFSGFLDLTVTFITSKVIEFEEAGKQTALLGFKIQEPGKYKLRMKSQSCSGLYRNSSGANFPMTGESDGIKIVSGDNYLIKYYYFFYNWTFTPYECLRDMELEAADINTEITVHENELRAQPLTGATYQWYNCNTGLPVAGAVAAVFEPSEVGTYHVTIKKGECEKSSECIAADYLSVKDKAPAVRFSIYPNPAVNMLTIEAEWEINKVEIISLEGIRILESGHSAIDISEIPAGTYFVNVLNHTGWSTERLTIMR